MNISERNIIKSPVFTGMVTVSCSHVKGHCVPTKDQEGLCPLALFLRQMYKWYLGLRCAQSFEIWFVPWSCCLSCRAAVGGTIMVMPPLVTACISGMFCNPTWLIVDSQNFPGPFSSPWLPHLLGGQQSNRCTWRVRMHHHSKLSRRRPFLEKRSLAPTCRLSLYIHPCLVSYPRAKIWPTPKQAVCHRDRWAQKGQPRSHVCASSVFRAWVPSQELQSSCPPSVYVPVV